MTGCGWKWLEMAGMDGNDQKWLKWLEMASMAGNGQHGWKWLDMVGIGWK